jgi:hypothetical protein
VDHGNGAPNFEEGIIVGNIERVTRIPKDVEQVAEELETDI